MADADNDNTNGMSKLYNNDGKNIINDKLWKMISNKYKQTIYYEEFDNHILEE